jgi:adenosylhomocysteine nucleosidase
MTDETEIDYATEDAVDDRPVGIISAVPDEEEAFTGSFREVERGERLGFEVRHGTIDGRAVVLARSGVGKVNAALAAMMLVQDFGCGSLIMAGVAGSLDPQVAVGDIVIATRLIQHDYGSLIDRHIKPFQPGILPLPGNEGQLGYAISPAVLAKLKRVLRGVDLPPLSETLSGGSYRVPQLHFGTIVSGDTFINCPATRDRLAFEFGALAVEMEGAAIAQVTERLGVTLTVVRAVSDLAGSRSHVDFALFAQDASRGLGAIVRRLATAL